MKKTFNEKMNTLIKGLQQNLFKIITILDQKKKDNLKLVTSLILIFTTITFSIAQMVETDPVASKAVNKEVIDRTLEDENIKTDIKVKDNQTAESINKMNEQQKSLMKKQIEAMQGTLELLNNTYNKAEKMSISPPLLEYLNTQRQTAGLLFQVGSILKFSSNALEAENRNKASNHLLVAFDLNQKGFVMMREVLKSSNNMTMGERMANIEKAQALTNQSQYEVIQAIEIFNVNSQFISSMNKVQQVHRLFDIKL
jgi:hypothetical protein